MWPFTHFPLFIPSLLTVSSSIVLLVHISPEKAQFQIKIQWFDRYGVKLKEHRQNPHPPQQDQAQRETLRLTSAPHPDDRQTQYDAEEQDRCAVIGGAGRTCLPAWLCSVTAADQGCAAPPRLEEWRDRWLLAAARAPQILWVTKTDTADSNLLHIYRLFLPKYWLLLMEVCHFQQWLNYSTPWHALQCLNLAENEWNKNKNCNRLMGAKPLPCQNVCLYVCLFRLTFLTNSEKKRGIFKKDRLFCLHLNVGELKKKWLHNHLGTSATGIK